MKKIKKERVHEIVTDLMNNECWDMTISVDDVKKFVWTLLLKFQKGQNVFGFDFVENLQKARLVFDGYRVKKTQKVCYQVKVNNGEFGRNGSFISMSAFETTYVSESAWKIFDGFEEIDEEETIKTIMSMLNEAWFNLRDEE